MRLNSDEFMEFHADIAIKMRFGSACVMEPENSVFHIFDRLSWPCCDGNTIMNCSSESNPLRPLIFCSEYDKTI